MDRYSKLDRKLTDSKEIITNGISKKGLKAAERERENENVDNPSNHSHFLRTLFYVHRFGHYFNQL